MKKQLLFILAVAGAGTICSSAGANGTNYFGADILCSKIKFKEGFGNHIFNKKLTPGVNLFLGHMFNDNFGAELGFEYYKKAKKTEEKIPEGTIVAGVELNGGQNYWELYKTNFSQRHPYLGLIINTKITENNYLYLLAGVSISHIKSQYVLFADRDGIIQADGPITRTFTRTKAIPMLRATFEHKFNNNLGLRSYIGWKRTSLFKMKSQENSASLATVKAKDSFNFGLGITYYIN